jgi:RimJ/RimL family protein N-acetyltransferase
MMIETERLSLRELTLDDAGFILELVNTEGWLRYIGDRGVRSISDAQQYLLQGPLESYRTNGFGLWLVTTREHARAIGMCGILKRGMLSHPDAGFAFLPGFTRQGYARESLQACLKLARGKFGLDKIAAITTPDNFPSQKVLEGAGFKYSSAIKSEKNEELFLFMKDLID